MQMLVMHKKPMQSEPLQKTYQCKFGANAILYNAMLGSANVANVIQSLQSWNQPVSHSLMLLQYSCLLCEFSACQISSALQIIV